MARRPHFWLAPAAKRLNGVVRSTPFLAILAAVVLTGSGLAAFWLHASGDQVLPKRSLYLTNANAGVTADYTLSFTIATPGTLGSISAQFCANDPLPSDPCTVPAGLDLSKAVLSDQSGETGFSISSDSTANHLILTRTPAMSISQPVSYTFTGVKNPSSEGSYYVRLQTFATSDATGAETDHGGIAFAINSNINISSYVPPYMLFCGGVTITGFDCASATGSYVDFGNLSPKTTSSGQTQLLIATNAESGYVISYGGTTLTSGNNIIPGLATADVSRPGVSQFGINLVANQDPSVGSNVQGPGPGAVNPVYGTPNQYIFDTSDTLANTSTTSDFNKYTISYIANISAAQPAGVYASTLTYVASAKF